WRWRRKKRVGVAAGRVYFTRSASRHRGSISVSADAYLVKSPAIHREPAVSFLPNIFAEAVKPVALRCSQRVSLNPLTETPQTAPTQRRRSRSRSKAGDVANEALACLTGIHVKRPDSAGTA